MPIIDVHAHLTPERYKQAIATSGVWHGLGPEAGQLHHGTFTQSVEERLVRMDADGVDMQVLTPTVSFTQYENDVDTALQVARECNDELADLTVEYPDRFAAMGIVPMQDVPTAIAELERIMRDKHMKGVMLRDHVLGSTFDEPDYLPFFQAAEALDAIVFFHQGGKTVTQSRTSRYGTGNSIGNLTERTLTYATLVFGGVMDACPELKPLLAHAGGYTAFGIARMDKIAGAFEGGYPDTGLEPPFPGSDDITLERAPSEYLDRFYYDCCTYDEAALRFLIDKVGIDRVMLGTDYPAPMEQHDPVRWIEGMQSLTADEKTAILSSNASALLGLA
jgi:aminocarboxymuconate-semialdehyde decarboxylase